MRLRINQISEVEVVEENNNKGHLSESGHLPSVETHLCFSKGGRRETSGWERKNKASKEEETSDNIQKGSNLLEHTSMTMPVTCVAESLDQLEPKKAHEANF